MVRTSAVSSRLRPLLLADDDALVAQGVELLTALGDGAVVDRLLAEVTYDPEATDRSTGSLPARGALSGPFGLRALVGLIGTGLGARATTLRAAITHLRVEASPPVLSAAPFAVLTALRELTLAAHELVDLTALRGHPTLRALHLSARAPLPEGSLLDLDLDALTLDGEGFTEASLRGLRARSVTLLRTPSLTSLAPLGSSLETLTLRAGSALDRGTLTRHARLHTLSLPAVDASCGALDAHPSLVTLTAERPELLVRSPTEVPRCALRGLSSSLSFARGPLEDLRGLSRFGAVETLSLSGCTRLRALDGLEALPALHTLDLRGCAALRDVSALAALPSLRRCLIAGVPLSDEAFPAAARATLSRALRVTLAR